MVPLPSNKNNVVTELALDEQTLAGVDKHFAGLTALTIAGIATSPDGIKAVVRADMAARAAADEAKSVYEKKLAEAAVARAEARRFQKALKAYVMGIYGPDPVVLGDFGIDTPKPTGPRTVKAKARAAALAQATREVRHTMGKRQKQAVKGTLPETAATPAPQAASTPAPTTPAAPAK